ncbi:MAG: SURF1 family protein [Chloroflexi bacterium]|nr:SURF1 family protein [Chloroflexota bacterium]
MERVKEQLQAVLKLFNREWWWKTLIVILGVIILAYLGIWQLHRRDYKRELNQMMAARWQMAPFDINREPLPEDLVDLQYRHIQATGKFDYAHQILLKNDTRGEAPGASVITPLVLDDNRAILVARGWVPFDQTAPDKLVQFNEAPDASVIGLIKESQTLADVAVPTATLDAPQLEWWRVDIGAIQQQMPYPLLPAFIAMLPESGRKIDALPMRAVEPEPFDELEHSSYAYQWFTFGAILGFGYLQLIVQQGRKAKRLQSTTAQPSTSSGDGEHPTLPAVSHQI